jgi:hypothetical protein
MLESMINKLLSPRQASGLILIVSIAATIAVSALSSAAQQPQKSIPSYATKVAGQTVTSGSSWGIWVFGGKGGQGCWGTRTVRHHEVTSESVTCGFTVPRSPFQFAASGSVGTPKEPRSLLFFLLRPSISHIEVFVERSRVSEGRWISIAARKVGLERRRASHLPGRLAFAVKAVQGDRLCPVRVRAYNDARLIGHSSLPTCQE